MIAPGHVDLATDDGFDPGFLGRFVKGQHGKQVAVLGDAHGVHFKVTDGIDQGIDRLGPIEQGEVRMVVQVDEVTHAELPEPTFVERS